MIKSVGEIGNNCFGQSWNGCVQGVSTLVDTSAGMALAGVAGVRIKAAEGHAPSIEAVKASPGLSGFAYDFGRQMVTSTLRLGTETVGGLVGGHISMLG